MDSTDLSTDDPNYQFLHFAHKLKTGEITIKMAKYKLIEEDGYTWIAFNEGAWEHAEFVEWTEGIPWHVRR